MPHVPGLRTPYAKVGRLIYFGRMLDKIRLHAAGKLPADYVANLGDTQPGVFDTRCCTFLGVKFAEVQAPHPRRRHRRGILAWCEQRGPKRSDQDCDIWNTFMVKRGWRDVARPRLLQRIAEGGFASRGIETFFEYIDCDEGRDPAADKPWEKNLRPALKIPFKAIAKILAALLAVLLLVAGRRRHLGLVAQLRGSLPQLDGERARPRSRRAGPHRTRRPRRADDHRRFAR